MLRKASSLGLLLGALVAAGWAGWTAWRGDSADWQARAWLSAHGVRSFREIPASQARLRVERDDATLIQVGPFAEVLPGAHLLPPGREVSASLLESATEIVVVSADRNAAYAFAARLARAGIEGVAVVEGGVDAWLRPSRFAAEPAESPRDDLDG